MPGKHLDEEINTDNYYPHPEGWQARGKSSHMQFNIIWDFFEDITLVKNATLTDEII